MSGGSISGSTSEAPHHWPSFQAHPCITRLKPPRRVSSTPTRTGPLSGAGGTWRRPGTVHGRSSSPCTCRRRFSRSPLRTTTCPRGTGAHGVEARRRDGRSTTGANGTKRLTSGDGVNARSTGLGAKLPAGACQARALLRSPQRQIGGPTRDSRGPAVWSHRGGPQLLRERGGHETRIRGLCSMRRSCLGRVRQAERVGRSWTRRTPFCSVSHDCIPQILKKFKVACYESLTLHHLESRGVTAHVLRVAVNRRVLPQ
jgi:hypothetical protein